MKNKKIQCGFHKNETDIRGDFLRCNYPAKFITSDFTPVCGTHKRSVDKMKKILNKPLCKPLSCERIGKTNLCDNTDLKVVMLHSGKKVLMCEGCRKRNKGSFEIVKNTGFLYLDD